MNLLSDFLKFFISDFGFVIIVIFSLWIMISIIFRYFVGKFYVNLKHVIKYLVKDSYKLSILINNIILKADSDKLYYFGIINFNDDVIPIEIIKESDSNNFIISLQSREGKELINFDLSDIQGLLSRDMNLFGRDTRIKKSIYKYQDCKRYPFKEFAELKRILALINDELSITRDIDNNTVLVGPVLFGTWAYNKEEYYNEYIKNLFDKLNNLNEEINNLSKNNIVQFTPKITEED